MTASAVDYSRKPVQCSTFNDATAHHMADSLLRCRLKTLSLYKDVMSYVPFEQSVTLQEVLEDFCEALVDYTAKSHFNLYSYLGELKENHTLTSLSRIIYPLVVDNTQQVLDFHDKYNSDIIEFDCSRLEVCLSEVGELLADRILLEDQIINAMMLSN